VSKGRSRDGVWKYSDGVRPYVVFAMERRDRAGHIAVRWTNPDKTGKFRRERKNLGITVRDPKTGRLDPRRVRAAELAVQQFQAKLVVGQPAPPPRLQLGTRRSSLRIGLWSRRARSDSAFVPASTSRSTPPAGSTGRTERGVTTRW